MSLTLAYIDKLQHQNANDLAFYPLSTLEKALDAGQIIHCEENGEAAGYLWFGPIRPGYDVTIYQACVDYELRRRYLGHGMVRDLMNMAVAGGATGIRLKCASSALSNEFWQAIGFVCTRVTKGGIRRSRNLNHYRTNLQPALFVPDSITPSSVPIDASAYREARQNGIVMPSRYSRKHYGAPVSRRAVTRGER